MCLSLPAVEEVVVAQIIRMSLRVLVAEVLEVFYMLPMLFRKTYRLLLVLEARLVQ